MSNKWFKVESALVNLDDTVDVRLRVGLPQAEDFGRLNAAVVAVAVALKQFGLEESR